MVEPRYRCEPIPLSQEDLLLGELEVTANAVFLALRHASRMARQLYRSAAFLRIANKQLCCSGVLASVPVLFLRSSLMHL